MLKLHLEPIYTHALCFVKNFTWIWLQFSDPAECPKFTSCCSAIFLWTVVVFGWLITVRIIAGSLNLALWAQTTLSHPPKKINSVNFENVLREMNVIFLGQAGKRLRVRNRVRVRIRVRIRVEIRVRIRVRVRLGLGLRLRLGFGLGLGLGLGLGFGLGLRLGLNHP